MDADALKAELLRLLAEDTEVRAAVLALVDPVRLKAAVVEAVREDAAARLPTPQPAPRAVTQAVSTTRIEKRPAPPWLQR